LEITRKTS